MQRVLIADDDPDVRALITFKLQQSGWEVTAVQNGTEALESVISCRPDVAVLDVMMPGMSGMEVCREIRSHPELDDLPVLLLTAKARQSDVEQGFAHGADDYIVKPFSPRELASRLQALMTAPRTRA